MKANVVEHRTGMVFETDPKTGQQVCTNSGTITWSSDWPTEAHALIATLRAERDQLASELREAREEIRILDIMSETGFDRMMHNGEQRDALAATIRTATDDTAVEAACDAFFSDPVMTWSLAIERSPELADEVRTRMRASLTAALSDPRPSPAKGGDHGT